MDSLVSVLAKTLRYSAQFKYPLTSTELWFWQIGTTFSKSEIIKHTPKQDFSLRRKRESYSRHKWPIAQAVANKLSRLPTIAAIFVTGSLAMNNSPKDDDIDFMVVTRPHTLWLTRLFVFLLLRQERRQPNLPEHSSARVADKICDNLYLESSHLDLKHLRSGQMDSSEVGLYIAHEILQAKCIFDRSNIAHHFLASNAWVGDYLPIAYGESLKKFKKLELKNYLEFGIWNLVLAPINLIFFMAQYLYMLPKITNEKISLHSAFFHPNKIPLDKKLVDLV